MDFILVFLGGGLGAVVRFFFNEILSHFEKCSIFALTIMVNIIGCFIMGIVFYITLMKVDLPEKYRMFLAVGFCGGLTTFSGFTVEIFKLIQHGAYTKGACYASISVGFSLIALFLGIFTAQKII